MIRVAMASEPVEFDNRVRQPGLTFLRSCPAPNDKQWKKHSYWQRIGRELYDLYNGVCAYTGEWFSRSSTSSSVDHFLPKGACPAQAFEWGNYRLTTPKINNYKGESTGIADPFQIQNGWFVMDFPSCLIRPGGGLSTSDLEVVNRTIQVLRLNDDDDLVQGRCGIILEYANGNISKDFLSRKYPFIYAELSRQNLLDGIATIFKTKQG